MKKEALFKYLQVFKVSLSEMFIWRLNFVLWRLRSVLQLLVLYFLWSVVFGQQDVAFGYTKEAIFTYILGTAFMRSMVLSSRSVDVAGEIHSGRLTNFLIRPVSYISWWLTRDISDKLVNLIFVFVELSLIYYFLRPPLFIQSNPTFVVLAIFVSFLALILYFYLSFLLSMVAFWVIEVWAPRFLAMVIVEFLSGGTFPIDILPAPVVLFLKATPFPYLIFFPLKIYLGQVPITQIFLGITVMLFWMVIVWWSVQIVWQKGLRVYSAEGQ